MCSCSYEDECLASKCEDYCKVAVPTADPKKATCKDNVCYCAKPQGPQEPTTTAPPCPIDDCRKACQEAEPNRKVLAVSCSAADTCSCSYEDECLASKCEDYCKVAVPKADPKKATCKDNVCYCAKPRVGCTPEACQKACQDAEPEKKVLNTSCPESDVCHCTYEDDCREDICRDYCKQAVPSNLLKTSMCINNYCYCNKTTDDTRRSKTDDVSQSGFNLFDAWNSFVRSLW
ncbi:uncharacterized protein LOC119453415 [Dermacentor silvarum]|uniref:uncharacterized protein LOC119453415 n=1 Tax=Dermacentor silvarum TaxID=543639 RepID=UPI001899C357|nr:uncharacterized protein LOC119453415 [Dermacentor silvarum]